MNVCQNITHSQCYVTFIGNSNCTNSGLALLNPKMPPHLFIQEQLNSNNLLKAQVFCKGQKLIGGPVNSTFENGIFELECSNYNNSWIQPTLWPKEENCIDSNKTCSIGTFPSAPGIPQQ